MAAAGNFESEFMQLVDLYLAENPTVSPALAHYSIRFAAAKVLLYKSGQGNKVNWPGRDAERLAAIFLVLYREESLRRQTTKRGRRKEILGLQLHELYELICGICRTKVSRKALITALLEVDLEGTVTQLVHDRKMEALWRVPETRSAYDALVASDEVAREKEAARRRAKVVKDLLARGLAYGRYVITFGCGVTVTLGDMYGWWSYADELPLALIRGPHARAGLNIIILAIGMLTIIGIFPDRLDTKGAQKYLLAVVLSSGGFATLNLCLSFHHRHAIYPADDVALTLCHLLFILGVVFNNLSHWRPLLQGRFSYAILEHFMLYDGSIYLLAALAFRHLGPPSFYPPGRVNFVSAICRSLNSFIISAMVTKSGREAVMYWLKKDPLDFNLNGVFGSTRAIFDSYDFFVAESARVEELQRTGASEGVQRAVRKRLASRLNIVRVLTCFLAMAWCMLAEYLQIWQTYRLNYGRAAFASFSIVITTIISASSFPSDGVGEGALPRRTFVMPANVVTALAATAWGISSYRRMSRWTTWEDAASARLFYLQLSQLVATWALWAVNAVLCVYHPRYSWSIFRAILFCDSLIYLVGAFAVRFVLVQCNLLQCITLEGCDPQTTFQAACLRGLSSGILSLVATYANRQRLATWSSGAGLHHVTLDLHQVGTHAGRESHGLHNSSYPMSSVGTDSDASPVVSMLSLWTKGGEEPSQSVQQAMRLSGGGSPPRSPQSSRRSALHAGLTVGLTQRVPFRSPGQSFF